MHPLLPSLLLGLTFATVGAPAPVERTTRAPAPVDPTTSVADPVEQTRLEVVSRLDSELARLVDDPAEYDRLVAAECRSFPEGDLFPYTLAVLAWAGLAEGERKPADLARMERLLELAERPVSQRTSAPEGRLDRLSTYRDQATYLCQLNLALAAFVAAGGSGRLVELHETLSGVILSDLEKAAGRPLNSFPSYTWPFDTVPCLLSIADYSPREGARLSSRVQEVLDRHLAWIEESGLDAATGLPVSRVHPETFAVSEVPRGCDLSWRLALLEPIAPDKAREWYGKYVKSFWRERFLAAGFAEWPGDGTRREDVDSGPIVMGIGGTATALGIAAAAVFSDAFRLARLVPQVASTHAAIAERSAEGESFMPGLPVRLRADRYTGFLYGDVVLFHALTWEKTARLLRPGR